MPSPSTSILSYSKKKGSIFVPPDEPSSMLVGYNMDFPGEGMRIMPFLDVFENARAWNEGLGNPLSSLILDSSGWITGLTGGEIRAYSVVMTGDSEDNPEWVGQRFALTWTGSGDIDIDGASKDFSVSNRIEFTGTAGNVSLQCSAGTIKNIKIIRTDRESLYASGTRYNPDFVTHIAPFNSLRFMDWAFTNSNPENIWSKRTVNTQPWKRRTFLDTTNPALGYSNSGYCIESIVAMCNTLQKHPHLHIGHLATDDYITQFATYVRTNLDSNLRATFELSNECWNFGFPQTTYFRLQGEAEWGPGGSAWVQAAGRRAQQMATIVKGVFTGQTSRVRTVQNVQTSWAGLALDQLQCPLVTGGGGTICKQDIDSIAITFYFAAGLQYAVNWPLIQTWRAVSEENAYSLAFQQLRYGTVTGLRNREDDDDITPSNANSYVNVCAQVQEQIDQATSLGLDAVYYEWDTHFDDSANGDHYAWLVSLCRRPEMKTLFTDILNFSNTAGIKIANAWGSTEGNTPWALASSMSDHTHAKYQAIAEWRVAHPLV